MLRKVRFFYKSGGSPAKGAIVEAKANGQLVARAATDDTGWAHFELPGDFLEELYFEGRLVLRHKLINDREELDAIPVPRPGEEESFNAQVSDTYQRTRGLNVQLFWHDGTIVTRPLKVVLWFYNQELKTETKEDGSLYIDLGRWKNTDWSYGNRINLWDMKWFVDGHQVDRRRISWTGRNYLAMILPDVFFTQSKGVNGGIITGKIVDHRGTAIPHAKITAEVNSSGFSLFKRSPRVDAIRSTRKGRFALPFYGDTELKKIYIDGAEPVRIYRINKQGEQVDLPAGPIHAGSYGLMLEKNKGLLTSLLGG